MNKQVFVFLEQGMIGRLTILIAPWKKHVIIIAVSMNYQREMRGSGKGFYKLSFRFRERILTTIQNSKK